ncbi:hypothetical protein V2J09_008833 [Rumex salicifolius]
MGGSSDTAWQNSDRSRGWDAFASSDRNLQIHHASRKSLSPDESQDSLSGNVRELKSDNLGNQVVASVVAERRNPSDPFLCSIESADVSLRQWLDNPERVVDVVECVHIFRQIVEVVSSAHSHGIVVNNVRPSCFVMSSINRVSFIESASCSDSGSDSPEEEPNNQSRQFQYLTGKDSHPSTNVGYVPFKEEREEDTKESRLFNEAEARKQPFPMKSLLLMETTWYTSPEEIGGSPSSCASDIYRLGVLLFELFSTFSSTEGKTSTMSSLRHRVLPPNILLKWPKEASFCLWLLHPDPSSRPKMGDLLQSDFLTEVRDDIKERDAAIELNEKIEEQDVLLEFLGLMHQTKQETASKLQDIVSLLSSDVEEVLNKQRVFRRKGGYTSKEEDEARVSYSYLPLLQMVEPEEATSMSIRKRGRIGLEIPEHESHTSGSHASVMGTENQESLLSKHARLVKNFKKLESAYLLTRCKPIKPSKKPLTGQPAISSNSRGSVVLTERSLSNSFLKEACSEDEESGWVSPFLEGLCKYLSYTKLRVKADLKQGDLLSSSNLVCSVSFDRDGEFFASAGVNKKIKVFECDAILNEDRDIHYPVVEMASRSKLSSVCWNSYIKSQIASSNFEGTVQVWDVTRGQVFMELKEHEKRVWSVDFSLADPTILASGSDDGSVKLWISASTDNTVKLWDLSTSTSRILDSPQQSYTGHVNVKNFVGLSVSDGYIATGSETNEVFVYHKAFPMPALSYKFNSMNSSHGHEPDEASQFISSVCWRGHSSTLVAANSTGDIKILEMNNSDPVKVFK